MVGKGAPVLSVLLLSVILRTECAFNQVPFVKTFSDEEVVAQWKMADKNIVEALETMTKWVMPMLIRSSSELDLTPECQADILKVVLGLRNSKMWAFKLVDAMGRPGSGMVSGSISDHGAFDQCLDLEVYNEYTPKRMQFRGQYCAVDLRPPLPEKPRKLFKGILPPLDNITFKSEFLDYFRNEAYNYYHISMRLGACTPSTCTKDDVQQIAENLAFSLGQHAHVLHCQVKEPLYIDNVQLGIFCTLGVFVALVSLATVAEIFLNRSKSESFRKSTFFRLVDSFSAAQTTRRLFAKSSVQDHTLSCLNGVRFFSITWVILVHTYLFVDPVMFRNGIKAVHEYAGDFLFQLVANASVAVDSFFFITGVLMSYQLVQMVDKKGRGSFNIPVIFIRRIWRLLPSAMLLVGLLILLPLSGNGPTWKEEVEPLAQLCRANWWYIPLFINNLVKPFHACALTTWYISADMQLFIAAIIFFLVLFRNQRLGLGLLAFYVVGSVVSGSLVTWYEDLFPMVLITSPDKETTSLILKDTYILPHVHLGCYSIGLVLGTVLARKKDISIPVVVQLVGWPLAIACNMAVAFGTFPWNSGRPPTTLESWSYAGFHRTAWGLGLAWMTLMCATGRGGWLNEFLSWSGYTVFNRLTYLVYLVQLIVMAFYLGNLRGIMDIHHSVVVWYFLGNIVMCFLVAYLCKVFFEGPLMEVERLFFDKLQRRAKAVQNGKATANDVSRL